MIGVRARGCLRGGVLIGVARKVFTLNVCTLGVDLTFFWLRSSTEQREVRKKLGNFEVVDEGGSFAGAYRTIMNSSSMLAMHASI